MLNKVSTDNFILIKKLFMGFFFSLAISVLLSCVL
nr:MAG TPA: hypothetical protein [Caudoviricetes sp.]